MKDYSGKKMAEVSQSVDQDRVNEAMQFLGGAMALDRLKEHLASQVIGALITIEEQKLYLLYGFKQFADFLDDHRFSEMSKSTFYRLRELYLKEGPEQYDLFTNWKVPLATRKLLTSGDIQIDGDDVIIGGEERVSLTNSGSIKAILEQLVREKIHATGDFAKSLTTISQQSVKLERASIEKERLEATINAMNQGTAYEQAWAELVGAFRALGYVVRIMDPDERDSIATRDLKSIDLYRHELSESYGVADWQLMMREVEERKETVRRGDAETPGRGERVSTESGSDRGISAAAGKSEKVKKGKSEKETR